MNDIDARVANLLARREQAQDHGDLYLEIAAVIAQGAAELMGRQADEVGILIVGGNDRYLRFVAPRQLSALGTIPLTKRDSIAVSVFLRKLAEANNNVPMAKRVAFFESVKVSDKVQPIMKMVTVPIVAQGQVIGVAQVSKKADSLAAAGPDFTAADVRKVTEFFDSVASFLQVGRPERF